MVECLCSYEMRLEGIQHIHPPPLDELLSKISDHRKVPANALRSEYVGYVADGIRASGLYEIFRIEEKHGLGLGLSEKSH